MSQRRHETLIVQDHLAQRGGAERVAVAIADALGTRTILTSVYVREATYPMFDSFDVRSMWFSRIPAIRRNHRWAFPFMAPGFSGLVSDADVTVATSAGWCHGVNAKGKKIVIWLAPARWLYQQDQYLGKKGFKSRAVRALAPALRVWDRRAVAGVDRHLAVSTDVADRLFKTYGIEAEILHCPVTLAAEPRPVKAVEPGFLLVVSRLLRYKNVHQVSEAMRQLPSKELIVVGTGPDEQHLRSIAPSNVRFLGSVPDSQLVWLYSNCAALVTSAFEDFGLTPLEAAKYGRPTVALKAGGFLDTIVPGETGEFFDNPDPDEIAVAIEKVVAGEWDETKLQDHAKQFGYERFGTRLREIVAEVLGQ